MATAGENVYDLDCAICTQILRDTRMLQCGHYFCKLCLETVAEKHPQGSVTCCICDHVTDTNGKDGVDKLREVDYITELAHNKRVEITLASPLIELVKVASFNVGDATHGLALDRVRERLVVRRNDTTAPITVYDFQGQKLQVLGKEVKGIAGSKYQGIAIDTKRDLYILPVRNGCLITMDMNGTIKDRIQVIDRSLHGVCYTDQDMYITSSIKTQKIYMVNPSTKLTCADFSPTTTFSDPYFVHYGQCEAGVGSKPVIIVSDWDNDCVKLLDYSGHLLYMYGKEGEPGSGDGELHCPEGVCTDPRGRVIVCDCDNSRVVSFYREKDKDGWEVLLGKRKLSGNGDLYHVVCDHRSRQLFVGYDNGDIIIFKG